MASNGVTREIGLGRTEAPESREDVRPPHHDALAGPCVVAYTTAAGDHPEVRRAAAEHARSHGCVLILYAADAASWFGEPLPSGWSGEGERDLYGDRLDLHDLHTLGRPEVASQVADVGRDGVRAVAWLPRDHGLGALAAYAIDQRAHLVFVPATFDAVDELSARFAGAPDAASELAEPALAVRVVQPIER